MNAAAGLALSSDEIGYMIIGLLSIAAVFYFNRHLYTDKVVGRSSALEWLYACVGLAALIIGWYFNIQYMREYAGRSGWWHWTTLLFVNPASASGGQDLIFANLILFPLWTMIDGRRRQMKAAWIYFPMSLVTSYAFGIAVFMAVQERQLRWLAAKPSMAGPTSA